MIVMCYNCSLAMGDVARRYLNLDGPHHTVIPAPGRRFGSDVVVTGWNLFAGCSTYPCKLYLQVWRPISLTEFKLVGQTFFAPPAVEEFHTLQLDEIGYIRAKAEDVIGFQFDYSSLTHSGVKLSASNRLCSDASQKSQYQNGLALPATVGLTYDVGGSGGGNYACRLYSFNPIYRVV